jgi:hypothetical protein
VNLTRRHPSTTTTTARPIGLSPVGTSTTATTTDDQCLHRRNTYWWLPETLSNGKDKNFPPTNEGSGSWNAIQQTRFRWGLENRQHHAAQRNCESNNERYASRRSHQQGSPVPIPPSHWNVHESESLWEVEVNPRSSLGKILRYCGTRIIPEDPLDSIASTGCIIGDFACPDSPPDSLLTGFEGTKNRCF